MKQNPEGILSIGSWLDQIHGFHQFPFAHLFTCSSAPEGARQPFGVGQSRKAQVTALPGPQKRASLCLPGQAQVSKDLPRCSLRNGVNTGVRARLLLVPAVVGPTAGHKQVCASSGLSRAPSGPISSTDVPCFLPEPSSPLPSHAAPAISFAEALVQSGDLSLPWAGV